LGALAGIACIITFILSFGYQENKKLILLTFDLCFNGFQAWLGKTVVDSVFKSFKNPPHAGCIINCIN
jgi:cytochrome c oxidase assembly protein subunit 15